MSNGLDTQYLPARYVGLRWNYETYSFYIAPCNGLQGPVAQYAANQTNVWIIGLVLFLLLNHSYFVEETFSVELFEDCEFETTYDNICDQLCENESDVDNLKKLSCMNGWKDHTRSIYLVLCLSFGCIALLSYSHLKLASISF